MDLILFFGAIRVNFRFQSNAAKHVKVNENAELFDVKAVIF